MRLQTSNTKTDDIDLSVAVAMTRAGQTDPLSTIMRAHNQRLFRIARSILRDDFEAEDIVQEVFIKAFTHADTLQDPQKISAWLGKIAVNMSRDRLRQKTRRAQLIDIPDNPDIIPINRTFQEDNDIQTSPERQAAMTDVRALIETGLDTLPDGFREVFMLRVVEQMSLAETSDLLDIPIATVKTRLHRAKILLRKNLEGQITAQSLNAFPFGGVHCARTTAAVLAHFQQGT